MATFPKAKRLKSCHMINNKPHNQFESLPNDIILDILDYLDEKHVQQAFHGLNQRFSQLIDHYSGRSVSLSFSLEDSSKLEQYCNELIMPNRHRIRSLQFNCEGQIQTLLSQCVFDESFARVESISFFEHNLSDLLTLLHKLPLLPRIKALEMKSDLSRLRNNSLGDIYSMALQCSTLTSLTVEDSSRTIADRSFQRLNIDTRQSSIEVLKCLHPIQLPELQFLLEKMPKLRRLEVSKVQSDLNSVTELFVVPELHQFTTLSIGCSSPEFHTSKKFIAGLGATIRSLKLMFPLVKFINNATEWNNLLNDNLPQLEKFIVELLYECAELFGLWNKFRQFSLNLLKLPRWDEGSWDITFNAHQLHENVIVFEFRKKRMLTSVSSKFTLKVNDSDTDRNLCCRLRDILKSSIQSSPAHLIVTQYDFELYQIPLITGIFMNLGEITIDGLMGSPAYFMEAIDRENFIHQNVYRLKIHCTLAPEKISILLQWFPSIQRLEIQLDGHRNELERREILLASSSPSNDTPPKISTLTEKEDIIHSHEVQATDDMPPLASLLSCLVRIERCQVDKDIYIPGKNLEGNHELQEQAVEKEQHKTTSWVETKGTLSLYDVDPYLEDNNPMNYMTIIDLLWSQPLNFDKIE
ncbi:unnamed protein product [Rotaria magnacalcarata]